MTPVTELTDSQQDALAQRARREPVVWARLANRGVMLCFAPDLYLWFRFTVHEGVDRLGVVVRTAPETPEEAAQRAATPERDIPAAAGRHFLGFRSAARNVLTFSDGLALELLPDQVHEMELETREEVEALPHSAHCVLCWAVAPLIAYPKWHLCPGCAALYGAADESAIIAHYLAGAPGQFLTGLGGEEGVAFVARNLVQQMLAQNARPLPPETVQ